MDLIKSDSYIDIFYNKNKHSGGVSCSSTPARIWKGQGATGQKGIVIRETEYLDSHKNMKISSPIQF